MIRSPCSRGGRRVALAIAMLGLLWLAPVVTLPFGGGPLLASGGGPLLLLAGPAGGGGNASGSKLVIGLVVGVGLGLLTVAGVGLLAQRKR